MLHLARLDRSYDPETIAAMSAAFERNCQFISKRMNDSADVKKTLAVIIVRLVDQGEHDPERLTEAAFREWTGSDRAAIGDRWGNRSQGPVGFVAQ
jgi:hypothetical protein